MNKREEERFNKAWAVKEEYNKIVLQSWTYAKLTDDEKRRWNDVWRYAGIRGTKEQMLEAMSDYYRAFLLGVGYDDFYNWREDDPIVPQF